MRRPTNTCPADRDPPPATDTGAADEPVERDNLGEMDTFDEASEQATAPHSGGSDDDARGGG